MLLQGPKNQKHRAAGDSSELGWKTGYTIGKKEERKKRKERKEIKEIKEIRNNASQYLPY